MPSPFPGMDPYLQRHWRDVHASLIIYARDQLRGQLPPDLKARVEERIVVETPWDARSVYPDLRVIQRPALRIGEGSTAVADAAVEPLVIHSLQELVTETFIQIIDASTDGRVVTAIELLSAANKAGPGVEQYLQKQAELMAAGVNLVEIDLLRGGSHAVAVPAHLLPPYARTDFLACVYRASMPRRYEVYPLRLREPLPAIRVPLRETDEDVYLGLQTLVNLCYENGAYEDTDYTVEPDPPLAPEDAEWADALLKAAGRRPAG